MRLTFIILIALAMSACQSSKTNTLRYQMQLDTLASVSSQRASEAQDRAESLAKQIAACTDDDCRKTIAAFDAIVRASNSNNQMQVPQPHYERDAGAQIASALSSVAPIFGAGAQAWQGVKQAEYARDQNALDRYYDYAQFASATNSLERVGIAGAQNAGDVVTTTTIDNSTSIVDNDVTTNDNDIVTTSNDNDTITNNDNDVITTTTTTTITDNSYVNNCNNSPGDC